MNKNRMLIVLVLLLIAALIGETAYLVGIKQNHRQYEQIRNTNRKKLASAQQQTRQLPIAWMNDPFFNSSPDPFEEMEHLQAKMNRLFRTSFTQNLLNPAFDTMPMTTFFEPDIDVSETDAHYIIKLDLPGMEKDKINVEVKNNYLLISGERKTEMEETQEGSVYRAERSFGAFSRTIPLPEDANAEDVTAEHMNGVLTVKIGKIKIEPAIQKPGTKVDVK